MDSQEMIVRLAPVVSSDYQWPEIPPGWRLEFIVYPDRELDMDLLHPVSGRFWSEDNDFLPMPIMETGKIISLEDLKAAGVPVMTTFGHAMVSGTTPESYLKPVKK